MKENKMKEKIKKEILQMFLADDQKKSTNIRVDKNILIDDYRKNL